MISLAPWLWLPLLLATAQSVADARSQQQPSPLLVFDAQSTYFYTQNDSLFGYALAAYIDQNSPYVTVGAPRDRVKAWRDEGDQRMIGRGYRCSQKPGNPWSCEGAPAATSSSQRERYRQMGHIEPSSRESQWMGASVAATSVGRDGYFAVCAPRFVSKPTRHTEKMWAAIGECQLFPGLPHAYHVISPCNTTAATAAGRGNDFGQCLGGFSSSVLGFQEGADSVLYFAIGLPGCYDSNGELFVGRFVNRNFTGGWTYHRQSGVERLLTGSSRSQYLGYNLRLVSLRPQQPQQTIKRRSVATVDLLTSRPVWAEANWKGALTVMDIFMTSELHVKDTQGRIGDYFGYSLAAADLDGDGIGDLIAGAPFYSNSSEGRVNSGRVYVYYGQFIDSRYSVHPVPTVLEPADWKTGHFGHSIATIGDVDDDGLEDLAVGCPYCGPSRNGEVHLYLSRKGARLRKEPHQVMRAESHTTGGSLKQFGWSLTGGVDFDGNGSPDMVIGSHNSAAITLYKTRLVVRLSVNSSDLQAPSLIDVRQCSSGLNDCMIRFGGSVFLSCGNRSGSAANDELEFKAEIDLDSRSSVGKRIRSIRPNASASVVVSHLKLRCNASNPFQEVAVIQPTVALADLVTPIVARLRLQPAWPQTEPNSPALHPDSDIRTDFPQIEMVKTECGKDNVCQPRLRLSLSGAGEIKGSAESVSKGASVADGIIFYGEPQTVLRLTATLENTGETAHEAVLRIRLPSQIKILWPVEATIAGEGWADPAAEGLAAGVRCSEDPSSINTSTRVLVCLLGRQLPPLPTERGLTVSIRLSIDNILGTDRGPNFTLSAEVTSQEAKEEKRKEVEKQSSGGSSTAHANFAVFIRADLQLGGTADRDVVVDTRTETVASHAGNRYRVETLGVHFNHSFELLNTGPSPLHEVEVNLTVPVETESGDILVYLLHRLTRVTTEGQRETFVAAPRVLDPGTKKEKVGAACVYTGLNRLNLTFWRDEGRPGRGKRATALAETEAMPQMEADARTRASLFGVGDSGGQALLEPVNCGGGKTSELFGRVRCALVRCRIGRLSAMEKVQIVFDGLVWAETLFTYQVPAIHLRTGVVVSAGRPPFGLRIFDRVGNASSGWVETAVEQFFFFKGVKPRPAYKAPLWIILVAVLLGLLLLAAIVIGLWRCGFFQRRRWFVDKPVQL